MTEQPSPTPAEERDSQWVKVPGGEWLRFDPLTDEDMAAVVRRLDTDYGQADIAGRYAWAWLDVARLLSTFAAVQSLIALQTEAAALADSATGPLPADTALREAIRKLWTDADAIQDSQTGTQKARNIAAEALRQAAVTVERALVVSRGAATGPLDVNALTAIVHRGLNGQRWPECDEADHGPSVTCRWDDMYRQLVAEWIARLASQSSGASDE